MVADPLPIETEYPWPWHVEDELRRRIDAGYTAEQMAEELGTSRTTVQRWLDRHDLETQAQTQA